MLTIKNVRKLFISKINQKLVESVKTDDELVLVNTIDQFCEKIIQPNLDKWYQELADMMNAYQQKMQMKRETIANKGIWRGKKMYILNAWNVEGVQYETDSCYETDNKILLIEGKSGNPDTFNIRQLYFPYRSIYDSIGDKKEIICLLQNKNRRKHRQTDTNHILIININRIYYPLMARKLG